MYSIIILCVIFFSRMESISSLLQQKPSISSDGSIINASSSSASLPSISGLNSAGYPGNVMGNSGQSHCLKCMEIYNVLNQHILENHRTELNGSEKDGNSMLNNVLMNILMLLTSSGKAHPQPSHDASTYETNVPSSLANTVQTFNIVTSNTHLLPKAPPTGMESTSNESHITADGLVTAESLQKLLSSAQANQRKVLSHSVTDNERRKTVVCGIPLITSSNRVSGSVPMVLTSQFQQNDSQQAALVDPSAAPKVSEKSDLDVADILVNKMPIPSVNKEETSLAQLYLKQLAEGLAAGSSGIFQQADAINQSNSNDRELVTALLNGSQIPPASIAVTSPPACEGNNKPVVETISQIIAAQKQLSNLLSLLGKKQTEPALLPVAGLASQLVETPLNNPLFTNQTQKASPSMLQVPLSILPGLVPSSQGLLPTNLVPISQSTTENAIYPQIASIFTKTSQGVQRLPGAGAVALPTLALNTSIFQSTPVPVLQQTIQGALRVPGQQAVLLPSVIPGSITTVSSSSIVTQAGIQPFLVSNRPLSDVVTQPSNTSTKTLFSTNSQPSVPTLTEQLFQNSSTIPKLSVTNVSSIFNLPGMSSINSSPQRAKNQGQPTFRQIPILPTSSVIISTGATVVPSVDKIQGLISAALQNPSKGNTFISSTVTSSANDDPNGVFGKGNLSTLSMESRSNLVEGLHDNSSIPKKLYKCFKCDTTFSVLSTLQQHEQTHFGRRIQCNYCNDIFMDNVKYQEHIALHRGEENVHQCEYCSKLFTSRGELQKHLAEHTQKRPYKCKHCAKAFRDPGSLQKHERIHTGERPYKCNNCSKAFAEYSSLRKHNRVHTGEKPYKCQRCPKAFSISGNLQRHMYIHTGERPYRCTKCPKAFNNPSHLRRHVKNLHEGKGYVDHKGSESNMDDSDSEMADDLGSLSKN